ncbi:MAG TPA: VOC family protein [Dehalococcoidia bacterium]|nr:VOC family protein [Dehalococcoidia bacterium]
MEPRITVLTLGVDDLERSLAFYRDGLGLPTEGIIGTEFEGGDVVFFHVNEGMILALYPRQSISKDSKLDVTAPSPTDFTIGHNVASIEEVDSLIEEARKAGATIPDPPRDRSWGGYSGHFQDPDGHLWEIVWNPSLDL